MVDVGVVHVSVVHVGVVHVGRVVQQQDLPALTSAKVSASVNPASAIPFLSWSDNLLIGS